MTQKSMQELLIEQAVSRFEDEPALRNANRRELAEKIVSLGIEGREEMITRAIELHNAPPEPEPREPAPAGTVIASAPKGGKVARPESVPEALWAKFTSAERLHAANQQLASERVTIPSGVAERAEPDGSEQQAKPVFAGGRFMEHFVTGKPSEQPLPRVNVFGGAATTEAKARDNLAKANDQKLKTWEAKRRKTK